MTMYKNKAHVAEEKARLHLRLLSKGRQKQTKKKDHKSGYLLFTQGQLAL